MTDPFGLGRLAREDQQRAAERHARQLFDRHTWALPGGGTRAHIPADRVPGWLRELLATHQAALNGPTARACDHVADGQAVPRCVVAWHPGIILCARCMATGVLMPDRGSDAEYTCDGCGRVSRDGLRTSVIQIMPDTTFHLAVCADCRATLERAEP